MASPAHSSTALANTSILGTQTSPANSTQDQITQDSFEQDRPTQGNSNQHTFTLRLHTLTFKALPGVSKDTLQLCCSGPMASIKWEHICGRVHSVSAKYNLFYMACRPMMSAHDGYNYNPDRGNVTTDLGTQHTLSKPCVAQILSSLQLAAIIDGCDMPVLPSSTDLHRNLKMCTALKFLGIRELHLDYERLVSLWVESAETLDFEAFTHVCSVVGVESHHLLGLCQNVAYQESTGALAEGESRRIEHYVAAKGGFLLSYYRAARRMILEGLGGDREAWLYRREKGAEELKKWAALNEEKWVA